MPRPRGIALRVLRAEAAGPGVRRIELGDPDGWELPRFKAGAHLDLLLPDGTARPYSLCSDPAEGTRWAIAVKREAEGRGASRWLHDSLREGDTIEARMPRCTFPLAEDAAEHVFLAGGIGVTPFLAMLPAAARLGAPAHLHLLSRGTPPLDLTPHLAAGRATLHDTAASPRPGWEALLGAWTPRRHAYCCGPEAMNGAFLAEAAALGWPAAALHVEHFHVPPPAPAPGARDAILVLAQSGREVPLAAGETILTALRRAGVEVDSSCEGGICSACRLDYREGTPLHRDRILRPEERARSLMACVAQVASGRLVLDL